MGMRMSSSRTYSKLSHYDTLLVWVNLTWIEKRKKRQGLTLNKWYPSLISEQIGIWWNKLLWGLPNLETIHCNMCIIWTISTNKNSVTDALKPAVFSVNFTQFPHRIAFMVRIMKVFSSWKIPRGPCPQESLHPASSSAMGSSSCESAVQLLCAPQCGRRR